MKQVSLKIFGQVQGVGLRYQTDMKARQFNVTGWARNENDGTVKILAQGDDKNINKLVTWLKSGESYAQIEKVEIEHEEVNVNYNSFNIENN